MDFMNWKPWALIFLSAGAALMLSGDKKLGFILVTIAGVLFEIANAINGGKYFD